MGRLCLQAHTTTRCHDPLTLAAAARCGGPRGQGARGLEEAPAVPKIRTGAANGPASSRDGIGRFDGERDNFDFSLGGQAGIMALEPVLELVDACGVVEPSLCCGEMIEAVAFDAGDGAFQRAVGFVVLEEEDCGTRRDRIVIADGGSLPRRGDGLVVALVEPDNATRTRIGEEIGVRQQLVNGAQLRSVVGRYGDEDVGMEIEKHLAAAAARRD
jgi:hypothetical protein